MPFDETPSYSGPVEHGDQATPNLMNSTYLQVVDTFGNLPDNGNTNVIAFVMDEGSLYRDTGSSWVRLAQVVDRLLQIQQTVKTNTFTASVGQGAQSGDVTGLTVAITPSSVSNKVLVRVSISVSLSAADKYIGATLFRDGSAIFQGDAGGNRQRVSGGAHVSSTLIFGMDNIMLEYLDEPSTTDEVSYSIRLSHSDSSTVTVAVNRSSNDGDLNTRMRGASSITAMEIAG